jgi:hypothetical protein
MRREDGSMGAEDEFRILKKIVFEDGLVKPLWIRQDESVRMLEHIFGSKTRVKLLSLFLRRPDEQFFVREITRRINTQINAVRRELANLVKLGLLIEASAEDPAEGEAKRPGLKRKYYKINSQFALLSDLSALVLNARVLLENRLDQEILKMGDIRYLALLGSLAGRVRANTPVELFIVGEVNKKAFDQFMKEMESELGFEINFSIMPYDEYLYRKDITDRFLYAILEAPKNVIIDRLRERVSS